MPEDKIPVVLDLNIETQNFEKDINNAVRDLKSLQRYITDIANIDLSSLNKGLSSAAERYISAARKYSTARADFEQKNDSFRTSDEDKAKALANYLESYRKLQRAQAEYYRAEDANEMSDNFQRQTKQVEKLKAELDKLNDKSKEMSKIGASDSAWESINAKAQTLKEKLYEITTEMRKTAKSGEAFRFGGANNDATAILDSIKKTRKEVQGIAASITVKKNQNTTEYSEAYTAQLKELSRIESAFDKVQEKYNKLLATGKNTPAAIKGLQYDLQRIQERAEDARGSLDNMVDSGEAFKVGRGNVDEEFDNIASRVDQITNSAYDLQSSLQDNTVSLGGFRERLKSVMESARQIYKTLQNGFNSAAKKGLDALNKGVKKLLSGFKGIVSHIGEAIKGLIGLKKHGNSTGTSLSKTFKKLQRHILMFGFGFRTAYFAIKRLRTIFVNAFKTMAAQFPEINAQLNSLTMACNRLKGSLGTMFQPIVSVAIPILVRLMEYLSRAMEVAANFFAVLTGQRVIYRAVSNQEDYAASLYDTAKAEKDARKEHEKTIASYDKLEVIDQDKNTGSNSSNDVNTPDLPLNVTYEQIPVEDAISEFAERVKQAWAAADFTEIGEIFTAKILAILERIRVNIVPKITKFINKLARVIITFVDGADFTAIGAKVGDIINDIISQLDADRIGQALASIYNVFWRFADGLVNNIQWAKLGEQLAKFVMGFVNKLDADAIINTLAGLLNGITDTIDNFVDGIDWEKLATKIGNAFAKLFSKIDPVKIINSLIDLLNGIFTTVLNLIQRVDFSELGKNLATGANNILQGDAFSSLLKNVAVFLGEFVSGCVEFLVGFITNFDWSSLLTAIENAVLFILNTIQENFANSDNPILQVFGDLLGGIKEVLEDIFDVIDNIIQLIRGDIDFETFISNLSDVEIVILAVLAAIAGVSVALGLASVAAGVFGAAMAVLTSPITLVVAAIGAIVAIVLLCIKYWDQLQAAAGAVFSEIRRKGQEAADWFNKNVIQPVKKFFVDLGFAVSKAFINAWTAIKTVWYVVTEWFDTVIIKPITNFFSGLWEGIRKGASDAWDGIKRIFGGIADWFGNIFHDAWQKVKDVFSTGGRIFEGIVDGIVSAFKEVVNAIIRGINWVIAQPFNAINWVLNKLRNIDILGIKPFKWIGEISVPEIPLLAQGAVIPPNKEFLAVLGDQHSGTNIEAPLDTIKQAVREVLNDGGLSSKEPIVLQINGRDVAKVVWDENAKRYRQTGKFSPVYNS